jgi:two-component system response regulator HydG
MQNPTDLILPVSNQNKQVQWANGSSNALTRNSIVFKSEAMRSLLDMVDRVAPTLANVLIQGESGTGKELIARQLHERSMRAHRPFVALNCATLKDSLLESELFGHEKGAFTGAVQKKIGMAEAANGGTLFLDEIGELSLSVQTKLLRFLQEGEFYRVGGKDIIKVDVRVVCATNRDLEQEVQKGNFREDLFYRVNTILLETAPLRRRKEDIPLLVQHFMQRGRVNLGRPILRFSDAALKALMSYDWPGNIRELENLCERLQVLAETDLVELSDLPDQIVQKKQSDPTRDYDPTIKIADLERTWILKAMEHFRGNKTQASVALGITIKTLYNKLHEYGVFEKYALHSKAEND